MKSIVEINLKVQIAEMKKYLKGKMGREINGQQFNRKRNYCGGKERCSKGQEYERDEERHGKRLKEIT